MTMAPVGTREESAKYLASFMALVRIQTHIFNLQSNKNPSASHARNTENHGIINVILMLSIRRDIAHLVITKIGLRIRIIIVQIKYDYSYDELMLFTAIKI